MAEIVQMQPGRGRYASVGESLLPHSVETAIAAATNRKIGGQAPGRYLFKLQREAETSLDELRARVEQHHVDFDLLASDAFDKFFDERRKRLLDLIAKAMGKPIRSPAVPSLPEEYDLDEEEPSDDDIDEPEI
jgi:hypothetical protein